jgi:hypothetical protein
MSAVNLLLIDLVSIAETPLYSAYRWLDRRLANKLALTSFLALVEGLVTSEAVRLWSVDAHSGDRTELYAVPDHLGEKYSEFTGLDEAFDPFGLSLTLGTAVHDDVLPDAQWSFDLDVTGRFELRAPDDVAEAVLRDVEEVLPGLLLRRSEARQIGGGQVVISGSSQQRPTG